MGKKNKHRNENAEQIQSTAVQSGIALPDGNVEAPAAPAEEVAPVETVAPTAEAPAPEAPAAEVVPAVEEQKAEEPKKEAVAPVAEPSTVIKPPKEKVMSGEILAGGSEDQNTIFRRRALAATSDNHTATGKRLLELFEEYRTRMSTPSNDEPENVERIKMLYKILQVACPVVQLDMTTATDVVRIVFDRLMDGWGTTYTDTTVFRLGKALRGSAAELDKFVMFIEAFVQMIEAVSEKKKVMFDDNRLTKVLKNTNVAIAMARIKNGINKRNGFAA